MTPDTDDKKSLRRWALRQAPGAEEAAERSRRAFAALFGQRVWRRADIVLAYRQISAEVHSDVVMEEAARTGKPLYLPRVAGDTMTFRLHESQGQLVRGQLGVFEPGVEAAVMDLEGLAGARVLVVVPGLAFDGLGIRLGRGAGYYDRFVPEMRAACGDAASFVGVCYRRQLRDRLPRDPWDAPMDWVLTEEGVEPARTARA